MSPTTNPIRTTNNPPLQIISPRKLNPAQRNYTTGEKELLSIVATLNEYRTMLYGCRELHVHTDHKNLTFNNLQTQRVLRWRLFIEEFGPQFHYVKGSDNPVADALSRLSFSERQNSNINIYPENPRDVIRPRGSLAAPVLDSLASFYTMVTDDPDLLDCFVHLPDQQDVPFQMDYQTIAQAQAQDNELLQQLQTQPYNMQQRFWHQTLMCTATDLPLVDLGGSIFLLHY
jgi:RNase H-like domain found in reverse transcriptase